MTEDQIDEAVERIDVQCTPEREEFMYLWDACGGDHTKVSDPCRQLADILIQQSRKMIAIMERSDDPDTTLADVERLRLMTYLHAAGRFREAANTADEIERNYSMTDLFDDDEWTWAKTFNDLADAEDLISGVDTRDL